MPLTAAQLPALKAALLADTDPTVQAAVSARNDTLITQLYNADSTFVVWRTSVTRSEMHSAYVWTEMDSFTNAAKQFQFNLLISEGTINPSTANIRQGLQDIFAGPGLAATRTALIALMKRFATKAEAVFATGTGTDGDPGTLVYEGDITIADVGAALNLP